MTPSFDQFQSPNSTSKTERWNWISSTPSYLELQVSNNTIALDDIAFINHTTGPKDCGKSSFHLYLLNRYGGQVLRVDLRDKNIEDPRELVRIMADALVSPDSLLASQVVLVIQVC